jgi:hypothetical protein
MKSIIRKIGQFLIAATSQPVPVKAQPQVLTIPPGVGTT